MYSQFILLITLISSILSLRSPRSAQSPYRYTFPDGKTVGIAPLQQFTYNLKQRPVPPIKYKKGAKIMKKANVYNIFYGNWTDSQKAIVNDFISSIGESDWYATNTKYYQETPEREYVTSEVNLAGSVHDPLYTQGLRLKSAWKVIQYHLENSFDEIDEDGIYFVYPSSDVTLKGSCTSYCGWHSFEEYDAKSVIHGYIAPCKDCAANDGKVSPNMEPLIDGMVDTLAHELVEAVSDPLLDAWLDRDQAENGDKCNWKYGKTLRDENSAQYNIILGERRYFIQQNWDPELQTCVGGL